MFNFLLFFNKKHKQVDKSDIYTKMLLEDKGIFLIMGRYLQSDYVQDKLKNIPLYTNIFMDTVHSILSEDTIVKSIYDEIANIYDNRLKMSFSKDINYDKFNEKIFPEILESRDMEIMIHEEIDRRLIENIKNMDNECISEEKYIKTYGNEPDGDPKLHNKEKTKTEESEDINIENVNDLLETDTVEDI